MKIDINKAVYVLVTENPELKDILINMGFKALDNPLMFNTMAKKVSLKRGAKIMGIENLSEKLEKFGYEVVDSSNDDEVVHRKLLLKNYIERLSNGENLEAVRKDFVANFEGVSSSEIMDAEEELLSSGIDKEEVRKLCDVHSALFHGMTDNEKNEENYDGQKFISYMARENEKVKELIKKAIAKMDFDDGILKICSHYKKKGDLIYPLLKVKYNKPGPSDIMWAVDVEISKNLKRAIKDKNKKLFEDCLTRADEMTYKEENILYPLLKDTFTKDDLDMLYEDLKDYEHNLISYADVVEEKNIREDDYIHFRKGKMRVDQLEAMLDTMEFEITFVDDNDINSYYNDNKEAKVFKRPMSSLGREVYSCHPPQIEPMVRALIKDFKEKKRDSLKLVKKIGDKDYQVSYYAVRDKNEIYKGVLEIVQDMSFYKDYLKKQND